jgi:hypothetical protein
MRESSRRWSTICAHCCGFRRAEHPIRRQQYSTLAPYNPDPSKEVNDMRTPPTIMIRVLAPFAPLFSERVFEHVQALVAGAILPPGKRTVSSALRAMGLDQRKTFHRYHRVLSRAKWSSVEVSRVLLDSLVEVFVAEGAPLVVGIDETLERRQGKRISAKGIYRDPVRSSHTHLVKTSALRWICVVLFAEYRGLPGCGLCLSSRR